MRLWALAWGALLICGMLAISYMRSGDTVSAAAVPTALVAAVPPPRRRQPHAAPPPTAPPHHPLQAPTPFAIHGAPGQAPLPARLRLRRWLQRCAWGPRPWLLPAPLAPPQAPPPLHNQGLLGVAYSDPATGVYLGSPSIARLDADTLLMAHVRGLAAVPLRRRRRRRPGCQRHRGGQPVPW